MTPSSRFAWPYVPCAFMSASVDGEIGQRIDTYERRRPVSLHSLSNFVRHAGQYGVIYFRVDERVFVAKEQIHIMFLSTNRTGRQLSCPEDQGGTDSERTCRIMCCLYRPSMYSRSIILGGRPSKPGTTGANRAMSTFL